jgi:hypothetical protein
VGEGGSSPSLAGDVAVANETPVRPAEASVVGWGTPDNRSLERAGGCRAGGRAWYQRA